MLFFCTGTDLKLKIVKIPVFKTLFCITDININTVIFYRPFEITPQSSPYNGMANDFRGRPQSPFRFCPFCGKIAAASRGKTAAARESRGQRRAEVGAGRRRQFIFL